MHSSRMRTIRCNGRLLVEVSARGSARREVSGQGGVCTGVCLPRGVCQEDVCRKKYLPCGVSAQRLSAWGVCPGGGLPRGVSGGSARVGHLSRGVFPGGCLSRGCLPRGRCLTGGVCLGVSAQGCLPGAVCPGSACQSRGCLPRGCLPDPPLVNRMSDRCKNITFPQLRLDGNYITTLF